VASYRETGFLRSYTNVEKCEAVKPTDFRTDTISLGVDLSKPSDSK
jgi:hypothetical protein